jgi:hypothetical protein
MDHHKKLKRLKKSKLYHNNSSNSKLAQLKVATREEVKRRKKETKRKTKSEN